MRPLVIKCYLGHPTWTQGTGFLVIQCFSDTKVISYISRNKWHSLKKECIYRGPRLPTNVHSLTINEALIRL